MNIHEYQAKALLKGFGAPVAAGVPVFSADQAEAAGYLTGAAHILDTTYEGLSKAASQIRGDRVFVQMLQEQEYGGHASIHDDAMAEKLGFRAGPIEGPTHFSLFPPLMEKIWGQAWYERGCISSHYLNMVVDSVRGLWMPGGHEGSQASDHAGYRALTAAIDRALDEEHRRWDM